MPLTLIVRGDHGQNQELSFDGARIVIGRKSGCELWIPDPSVSQRHASVRAQGSDFALFDEGSANGTFVSGVRLERGASRQLRSGDMIRLGRVWIEVRLGGNQPVALHAAYATRDVAMALVAGAMQAAGDDISPRIAVLEGYDVGHELLLREDSILHTIGRGEACSMPLSDPDASREHVGVVRRAGAIWVKDLGSKNGAYLGERRLPPQEEVQWRSSLAVKLGRTVLGLVEPIALALAQLEEMGDEPVRAEDIPREPPPSVAVSSARSKASACMDAPTLNHARAVAQPAEALHSAAAQKSGPGSAMRVGAQATHVAKDPKGWNATDVALVVVALSILGLSLVGLAWVLRG
jgi:predicted component of type VI protein secretion system